MGRLWFLVGTALVVGWMTFSVYTLNLVMEYNGRPTLSGVWFWLLVAAMSAITIWYFKTEREKSWAK